LRRGGDIARKSAGDQGSIARETDQCTDNRCADSAKIIGR